MKKPSQNQIKRDKKFKRATIGSGRKDYQRFRQIAKRLPNYSVDHLISLTGTPNFVSGLHFKANFAIVPRKHNETKGGCNAFIHEFNRTNTGESLSQWLRQNRPELLGGIR